MDSLRIVLDYEPPRHPWQSRLRAFACWARQILHWLCMAYDGRLCVLATFTLAPIVLSLVSPLVMHHGRVFHYSYERTLPTWLAAYAFAFWPAFFIVHCRPFSRPSRPARPLSAKLRAYFLSLMVILIIFMQGLVMFDISEDNGHYIIVAPLMYAACAVFGWYSSLFKQAAALRLCQWAVILIIIAIAASVWVHRCPHATIVRVFGISVYQHGKPCGNFKRYLPWYLDPWR